MPRGPIWGGVNTLPQPGHQPLGELPRPPAVEGKDFTVGRHPAHNPTAQTTADQGDTARQRITALQQEREGLDRRLHRAHTGRRDPHQPNTPPADIIAAMTARIADVDQHLAALSAGLAVLPTP